jgi:hypothetical protein
MIFPACGGALYSTIKKRRKYSTLECDPDWIQTNDLPACGGMLYSTIKKRRKYSSLECDPDWIQTNDLLLRRQLLYSTELPDLLAAQR